MFNSYTVFAAFSLLFSLFFLFVIGKGANFFVFYIGFLYAGILFFHRPLVRRVAMVRNPLLFYGALIFIFGLFLETLAFFTGGPLFCPQSFWCDVFIFGVPHYLLIAYGFVWTLRRYDFSVKELGFLIFLFWAVTVDQGSHFVGLFVGGIPGILGFIQGGLLLLFAFHGPYIIFEKKIRETLPQRSSSRKKYLFLILFQGAAIILMPLIAVMRTIVGV